VEQAVESNTRPPIAAVSGSQGGTEGAVLSFSAAGSVDPNGSIVSYAWSFGDGTTASGADVTHVYEQDGIYTVTVVVTDNDGLTDSIATTISVTNVAPIVGDVPGATLTAGQTYTAAGSFTDPGDQQWTATVNWGDGTAQSTATLLQHSFSLAHTYTVPGTYVVTVSIADDDVTATRTHTVTVSPAPQPLTSAKALVDQLVAANKLSRITGALLKAQITTVEFQLARGLDLLAAISLRAVIGEIDLLVAVGRLSAADAAPLRALLVGVLETLSS
jgi:PKD repeat protein